jgi:hypothetical protein
MGPKFVFEIIILVIFISLFRKFNQLSQDYQAEQRSSTNKNFVCVAKVLASLICILYFINTILFGLVGPIVWHLDMNEEARGTGAKNS